MTHQHPNQHDNANRPPRRRRAISLAPLAAAGAAVMLAACGSTHTDKLTPSQQAQAEAPLIAYAKCMRSHRAGDFPNPSISSLGGIGYSNAQAHALNRTSSAYQAAQQACENRPGASTVQRLLK
jgi:hypothetical protein